MKKLLILLATTILLSACRPTPESPIVVGKQNDGWRDSVILTPETSGTEAPEPVEYFTAPDKFTAESYESEKLTINYDAEVVYPENSVFPIYLMKERDFTQEEADVFLDVLIGDGYFYDSTYVVTKADIERSIQSVQSELERASEANNEDGVELYTQRLNELYAQLETAPEAQTLTPALRTFSTKETSRLLSEYADDEAFIAAMDSPDGNFSLELTEEELRRAEAEGAEAISGYCELPTGKLGYIEIYNDKVNSSLNFIGDYTGQIEGEFGEAYEPMSLEQAQNMAEETLTKFGVEYDFLRSDVADLGLEEGLGLFLFEYGIAYPNVDLKFQGSPRNIYVPPQEYGQSIVQETINIAIRGGEIIEFAWNEPVEIIKTEAENTKLMPFADVAEIVKKGLEFTYEASEVGAGEDYHIEIFVDEIVLGYMQVKKEDGSDERYYVPVWDVIGQSTVTWENDNETGSDIDEPYNLLTVNALDGTYIDRHLGY